MYILFRNISAHFRAIFNIVFYNYPYFPSSKKAKNWSWKIAQIARPNDAN